MLDVHRTSGTLTVASRLASRHVLAFWFGILLLLAAGSSRIVPRLALALLASAALVVLLGARTLRARFERGHVTLRLAVPFRPSRRRPLGGFTAARVETFAEARRRRADRLARGYAARSGEPMPEWLRPPDAPGVNDALRRIVLVAPDGEALPVTAWLGEREDLEPARLAIESVLR
jgi:hypothetical protein